jgi:L-seryl-tRNA(Ser) seleniumtransferase
MMGTRLSGPLSVIPSVEEALRTPILLQAADVYGRAQVVEAVRAAIAVLRQDLAEQSCLSAEPLTEVVETASRLLKAWSAPSPRRVLNLTGTVIHTNLGRAPLPPEAVEAMTAAALHPSNLEFCLEDGRRGDRDDHVEALLRRLTAAEAATVVNNNAAAVMLVLNTLALRKQVLVSRGELIEIGGSFRLPEIMTRAGAKLREVGTTNRTRIEDFGAAIGPATALLMQVHTSNYAIQGFTASVSTRALAELGRSAKIPLLVDLGSGCLMDLAQYGLPDEPTLAGVLGSGADVATFSGDKLLGGPQAGIIVGRPDLIARLKRNPMKRALRIDKLTIAALGAVLRLYADPDRLARRLPVLRLLSRDPGEILGQARRLAPLVAERLRNIATVEVKACESQVGSGALPTTTLPSTALALRPVVGRRRDAALRDLADAFRRLPVPVLGRLHEGRLKLDLRCLEDDGDLVGQLDQIRAALKTCTP